MERINVLYLNRQHEAQKSLNGGVRAAKAYKKDLKFHFRMQPSIEDSTCMYLKLSTLTHVCEYEELQKNAHSLVHTPARSPPLMLIHILHTPTPILAKWPF